MTSPNHEETPEAGVPPVLPPLLSPDSKSELRFPSQQRILAVLLSGCLGLFLVDAAVSWADEPLILFACSTLFFGLRALVGTLTFLICWNPIISWCLGAWLKCQVFPKRLNA